MTLVMKKSCPGQPSRCKEDECVLTLNKDNARILSFQRLAHTNKFHVPLVNFLNYEDCVRREPFSVYVIICLTPSTTS